MKVYLIRHADAVPMGAERVTTDADRPLSGDGFRQVERLAGAFRRLSLPLDRVATSPLMRARQTAEGLLKHLQMTSTNLEVTPALAPGKSSKKLAKFLRELSVENVALVGHQPDLSEHTAWLIGSKKSQVDFAKAAVACVVCKGAPEKGSGTLVWLATPEWQ